MTANPGAPRRTALAVIGGALILAGSTGALASWALASTGHSRAEAVHAIHNGARLFCYPRKTKPVFLKTICLKRDAGVVKCVAAFACHEQAPGNGG